MASVVRLPPSFHGISPLTQNGSLCASKLAVQRRAEIPAPRQASNCCLHMELPATELGSLELQAGRIMKSRPPPPRLRSRHWVSPGCLDCGKITHPCHAPRLATLRPQSVSVHVHHLPTEARGIRRNRSAGGSSLHAFAFQPHRRAQLLLSSHRLSL